eukprot:gene8023-biopygen6294
MLHVLLCTMAGSSVAGAGLNHRSAVFYGPAGFDELRVRFDLGLDAGARPEIDFVDSGVRLRGPLGGIAVLAFGNASVLVAPDPTGQVIHFDPACLLSPLAGP